MAHLGVNIDHVATLRQARRGTEPDPVSAAHEAEIGGADAITVHLREDRRHAQDRDVEVLRETVQTKLNLEMAATNEMLEIARRIKPNMATLVPEGRQEITTEGGLDVRAGLESLRAAVSRLHDAGIVVSAFIEADVAQVEAAASAGFDVCELHTGPYAHRYHQRGGNANDEAVLAELERVRAAGGAIIGAGMQFNAGHALNYVNVGPVAAMTGLWELHIGHAIVSRAVFTGMREAVREMKRLMTDAAKGAT